MDKKDLKLYVAPEMETINDEMESTLLAGSDDGNVTIDPGNDVNDD